MTHQDESPSYYLVFLTEPENKKLREASRIDKFDVIVSIITNKQIAPLDRKQLPRKHAILLETVREEPNSIYFRHQDEIGVLFITHPRRFLGLISPFRLLSPLHPAIQSPSGIIKSKTSNIISHAGRSASISPSQSSSALTTSVSGYGDKFKQWSPTMAMIFLGIMLLKILSRAIPRIRIKPKLSLAQLLQMLWRTGRYPLSANGQWRLLEHALLLYKNPDAIPSWSGRPRKQLPHDPNNLKDLLRVSIENGWKVLILSIIQTEEAQELLLKHKQQILQKMRDEKFLLQQLQKRVAPPPSLTPSEPIISIQETQQQQKQPPRTTVSILPVLHQNLSRLHTQKNALLSSLPLVPKVQAEQAFSSASQFRTPSGVGFAPTFSKKLMEGLCRMFPILRSLSHHHKSILENYVRLQLQGQKHPTKRNLIDLLSKPEFILLLSQYARDCLLHDDPSRLEQQVKRAIPPRQRTTSLTSRSSRRAPLTNMHKQAHAPTKTASQQRPKTQYQQFWQSAPHDQILTTPTRTSSFGAISRRNSL